MSLKKNFIFNLLFNVINVLFPFITIPYISRVLGVDGVGVVSFSLSFSNYFMVLAALGIPYYGVREIAKARGDDLLLKKTLTEIVLIHAVSAFVFSIVFLVLVLKLNALESKEIILLCASLNIILSFSAVDWYFTGAEDFRFIAIRSFVIKMLSFVGLFLFVTDAHDVVAYIILSVFSTTGSNIINFWKLRKKFYFKIKELQILKHLKPIFILFGALLSIGIYSLLDHVILGFLSNDAEVGYYSSGLKLNKVLIPFVTTLGNVVLPKIAFTQVNKDIEKLRELASKAFQFVVIVSVPMCFLMFAIAPFFIPLYLGNGFERAIPVMKILSPSLFFSGLSILFGIQLLSPLGFEKYTFRYVFYGAIVSVILNFVLIPYLFSIGAAISNLVTEICIFFFAVYFVKKHLGLKFDWSMVLKSTISSLPILFLYKGLSIIGFQDIVMVFLIVTLGGILYYLLQLFLFNNTMLLNIQKTIIKKTLELFP